MAQQLAAAFLSAVPVTPPYTFGNTHVGPGSYSKHDDGLGVGIEQTAQTSIAGVSNNLAIWRLRYRFFAPIPAGTLKIVLVALANENSVVAKVRVKWASVPMNSDPSSAALADEGITTVTWGSGSANKYIEAKITLDAASPSDASMLVLDLGFDTSGWTMTKTSTWLIPLIVTEQ